MTSAQTTTAGQSGGATETQSNMVSNTISPAKRFRENVLKKINQPIETLEHENSNNNAYNNNPRPMHQM